MHSDVENDAVKINYLKGYPSLAAFIASDKDKSTVIYRRFDRLSARNLLYLQSELAELEVKQDAFDREDMRASTERRERQATGLRLVPKPRRTEMRGRRRGWRL
jgi:hypothetical protein